jgi:hypothetical protein
MAYLKAPGGTEENHESLTTAYNPAEIRTESKARSSLYTPFCLIHYCRKYLDCFLDYHAV